MILQYDGLEFHAPSMRQMYAFTRDYVKMMKLFDNTQERPEVIVDVGANIGSTVIMWKMLYPEAKVFAIEPFPVNIEYLKKNTAHLDNIIIIEKAASDHVGKLRMSCDSENTGLAKVSDEGIEVQVDTLDEMVPYCDLIKIDVEGHDYEVIMGAQRLLQRKPVIVIETEQLEKYKDFTILTRIAPNDYVMVPK